MAPEGEKKGGANILATPSGVDNLDLWALAGMKKFSIMDVSDDAAAAEPEPDLGKALLDSRLEVAVEITPTASGDRVSLSIRAHA